MSACKNHINSKQKTSKNNKFNKVVICNIGWICAAIGVSFWFIESAIHAFLFKKGTFVQQLLPTDINEIWMRLLIILLLVVFGFYTQLIRKKFDENKSDQLSLLPINFNLHIVLAITIWTLLVGVSLARDFLQQKNNAYQAAKLTVMTTFKKDLVYRSWVSSHGGVYVPVTEETQPNPYLSHIAERDITTTSGKKLTLINPAIMTRQVHELGNKQYGVRGHITSLNPLRAENAPDKWEREALQAFDSGEQEVTGIVEIEGQRYMRLMRPLITEKSCLKCHAKQGYVVGDIRGGISISAPLKSYLAIADASINSLILGHSLLWLIGVAGIGYGGTHLKYQLNLRRAAEEDLWDSGELHRVTLESISDAVFITDDNGLFTYICPNVHKIFGYSYEETQSLGHISKLLGEELFCPEELHEAQEINNIETDVADKAGQSHTLLINIKKVNIGKGTVLYSCHDITERKQAEERAKQHQSELAHAARLSIMGQMATELAHELNQPLCAIMGHAESSLRTVKSIEPKNDDLADQIETIVKQTDRAAKIVSRIKHFAIKDTTVRSTVYIKGVVGEVLDIIDYRIKSDGIKIDLDLDDTTPIQADPIQIEQVVLNLIQNGIEALHEIPQPQRTLTISTKKLDGVIEVAVSDTGHGISEEDIENVFQSFFTTKTNGLGIGLSICRSIIESHGGSLNFRDNSVNGVTFYFTLPIDTKTTVVKH